VSESDKEVKILANTATLVAKLAGALKTKNGNLLQLIKFKKKGEGYYYSLSDKSHVLVNRGEEWYYIPFVPKDESDRICLYSPYLFSMAVFVMVPEDEIDIIGFN
jgi:hypothetical protein